MSILWIPVVLFFIALVPSAQAEELTLQGVIQDTSRNHLPGVRVLVEGTQHSTVSNDVGGFSLPVTRANRKPLVLHLIKEKYLTLKYIVKDPEELAKPFLTPIIDNNGLVSGTLDLSMSHAPDGAALKYIIENDRDPEDKKLDDGLYQEIKKNFGEKDKEQIMYRTRFPVNTDKLKGVFLISEHGIGKQMMESEIFWDFADKNSFALLGFTGNPIQRGIYPAAKLDEIITLIGSKLSQAELGTVPVITFGHSNGTGFSALYAALRPERTICWISYHSGSAAQLELPGVELSPGLVMHGTKDVWLKGQDQAVVKLRGKRGALITMMMEYDVAHWPKGAEGKDATFKFITNYSQASIDIRLKDGSNELLPLEKAVESAWSGDRYDLKKDGRQKLPIAPAAEYKGDKKNANYLPNGDFAKIWQRFSLSGK